MIPDGFSLLRGSSGAYYVRCAICLVAPGLEAIHLAAAADEAERVAAEHDVCNSAAPEHARAWSSKGNTP